MYNTDDNSLIFDSRVLMAEYTITGIFVPKANFAKEFDDVPRIIFYESPLYKKIMDYLEKHFGGSWAYDPLFNASSFTVKRIKIPNYGNKFAYYGFKIKAHSDMGFSDKVNIDEKAAKVLNEFEEVLYELAKEIGFRGQISTRIKSSPLMHSTIVKRKDDVEDE